MKRKYLKKLISMALIATTMISLVACSGKSGNKSEESKSKEKIEKVVVGANFAYYPFCYMDGEDYAGFEVDIWNEIAKREGIEVEFVSAAFSGLFGMIDKGKIDTIAQQVSKNEEREKTYNFSDPYCYSPLKFIVPKGNPKNIQTIDDLKGLSVNVGAGGNETDLLQEKYPNGEANIVILEANSLLPVSTGKTDCALMAEPSAAVEIKDSGYDLEIVGDPVYEEIDCYPFAKTDRGDAIRELVNNALKEMREDGTLAEISNKHFGEDITTEK